MEPIEYTVKVLGIVMFLVATAKLFIDLGRILKGQDQTDKELKELKTEVKELKEDFTNYRISTAEKTVITGQHRAVAPGE